MIDHRKIGRELELFCSDPLIGSGLPIWLPAGAAARHAIESYVREVERLAGYQHVSSPPMAKRAMYERSGHLPHFADDMFPPMALSDDDELVLRPSLCPHHAVVFASRGRSYRELPVRIAEIGGMYRAERSGVLGGLSRVRAISLNDAHNFCAPDDVGPEVADVLEMIARAHADMGFKADSYRLSLRGEGSDKYVGRPEAWHEAEAILRDVLVQSGFDFEEVPGEAAFYGPKIDVQIRDPAGRESTLSTVQVDFHQPEQFDLSYVEAGGARRRPVMVHRSIVGGFERLFAHLIEVHEGAFPVWYAPVQVLVLPVGDAQADGAVGFARRCVEAGLRAEPLLDGSLSSRVRQAAARKVPYTAVIGEREAAAGEVSLRLRDGRDLPARPAGDVVAMVRAVADARSLALLA
jgi:threonyl-tRNA synthetase